MKMRNLVAALGLVALCPLAWAGISEPGILLYGQVLNGSGQPVYGGGSVTWTYTPVSTGQPITVTTPLADIVAKDGTHYSYAVEIPLETAAPGFPIEPGEALGIAGEASAKYTRTATVTALGITSTRVVPIDAKDRIGVERIDLAVNGDARAVGDYHMADLDRNNKFSLTEVLIFLAYFNATTNHDYQTGTGPDGFAVGAGAKGGPRHSADYDATPWRFSLDEVLALLAHFNASDCHGYVVDFSDANDGYVQDPGVCGGGSKSLEKGMDLPVQHLLGGVGELEVSRRVAGFREGGRVLLEITLDYQYGGGAALTALGMEEYLPQGWSLDGMMTTASAPSITPKAGKQGYLEFAWFPLAGEVGSFSYVVDVTGDPDLRGSVAGLTGNGVYHVQGYDGGFRVETGGRGAVGNQDSDLDGDGISDHVETTGILDVDGDGIPNFLDLDSDDNGVPDSEQGANIVPDVDGDNIPDAIDTDIGNNGIPDSDEGEAAAEGELEADYDDDQPKAGLPMSPWSWALLVVFLFTLGCAVLRRNAPADR